MKDPAALSFGEKEIRSLSKDLQEPEWLLRHRMEALADWGKLPFESSPVFKKYADVQGIVWENISVGVPKEVKAQAEADHAHAILSGGTFQRTQRPLPEGVRLESFHDFLHRDGKAAERLIGEVSGEEKTKLGALNRMTFAGGYVVHAAKDAQVNEPVRIWVEPVQGGKAFESTSAWIVGDPASRISVIEERFGRPVQGQTIQSRSVRLVGRPDAHASFSSIESQDGQSIQLENRYGHAGKNAALEWNEALFGGALSVLRTDSFLEGDGAQAREVGVLAAGGKERVNQAANLYHRARQTSGKISVKMVFMGKSRGVFKGLIDIPKQATQANAYLAGHAVLLGKDASADAIPALKIENNEVKATHSASVAQLNDEQLFYLTTRGFSESQARKALVRGFLEPVLAQVHDPEVRARARILLEAKLDGRALEKPFESPLEAQAEEVEAGGKGIFEGHYKYR